jgi:hypothetical protein
MFEKVLGPVDVNRRATSGRLLWQLIGDVIFVLQVLRRMIRHVMHEAGHLRAPFCGVDTMEGDHHHWKNKPSVY